VAKKKWGKIGAPKSKEREAWMAKMRRGRKKKKKRGKK